MITVGGFNTAVDKTMALAELRRGAVNRASAVHAYPGGKGLHVACAVAALGEPAALVGLIDAAHRRFFEDVLAARGVSFDGIEVAGSVRTCLAIREAGEAGVTEILEPGPEVDEAAQRSLREAFLSRAARSELAVLSGSVPRGFGDDVYGRLTGALRDVGLRGLVDASGELLRTAVEARPYLVKPNREELEALLGEPVHGVAGAAEGARRLCARGVAVVVVSLGAEGALLAAKGRVVHARGPAGQALHAVGSGDCLLGGVAVGLKRGLPLDEVLRLGVACGTANTLSPETGFVTREHVEAVLPEVRVSWLEEGA